MTGDVSIVMAKIAMRDQLVTGRNRRTLPEILESARAISEHLLTTVAVRRAATVAAYVSIGKEPGTGSLIEMLHAQGRRVILPALLRDNDLDWAVYTGSDGLVSGGRGLLEPVGPRLGVDAIAGADLVLTPGLAVDRTGMRLGRGGGSYDRALGRVPVGTPVGILLYDGEVVDSVPADAHDRRVMWAVTPSGITVFPRGPR
jgi:5-formyltetrahydrofolate cyclo-ligase